MQHHWHPAQVGYLEQFSMEIGIPVYGYKSVCMPVGLFCLGSVVWLNILTVG